MGLRNRRTRVNWLATAEKEMTGYGHLSAATRPQVLTLVLTGNAAQRAQALGILDAEKKVHSGYERLATQDEIDGQAALSELTKKVNAPRPALPPWPGAISWRR